MNLIFLLTISLCVRMSSSELCTEPVCEFWFHVKNERSMLYTGHWRPYPVEAHNSTHFRIIGNTMDSYSGKIGSYVGAEDVISADGTERDIITINGQFPGPTIEVMEGSKVVVHVENNLVAEPLTIHWHGMDQRGSPWMDGVAYINQCPIVPRQSFTYTFTAYPQGTHWYHSHFGSQRLDGLYGALLVHPAIPQLVYHPVLVTEWYPYTGASMELNNPYMGGSGFGYMADKVRDYAVDGHEISFTKYSSALINGRGRLHESDNLPRTVFDVPHDSEVELRLIGAAGDYNFEVSVDDHPLSVVSSDGHTVVPMTVDSVIIAPGERYDVRILTNNAPSSYWLRVRTLRHTTGLDTQPDGIVQEALAIVRYENADPDVEPTTQAKTCTPSEKCAILNCPYPIFPPSRICISVAELQSGGYMREFLQAHYGLDDHLEDEEGYFFNYAFWLGPSINSRKFKMPRAPLFMGEEYIEPCDEELCIEQGCICTYIQEVPTDKTVDFVITSLQPGIQIAPHTIHLHGYSFAVLKIGYFTANETTGRMESPTDDIKCANAKCTKFRWKDGARPKLNLENPPLKDTFIVPPHGYAVVRFRTNNPGFWFFHCHQETHVAEGMAMVIKEGNVPDPPSNFPVCGDFQLDENKISDIIERSTISPGVVEQQTTTVPATDREEISSYMQDGHLVLEFGAAVGIMFGLILCGAVLAVCPVLIYVACRAKGKEGK